MSVEIPEVAVAFGSVTPPQGDVIELRIHLGCTKEVSSFSCLLQNFDKRYTVTNPINVGDNCHFDIGRGDNVPLILTGRVEEVEPESTPVENYIRVRGRCWGEKIFRRVVTKTYENQKGEAVVRDLIDCYVGLSHTREKSDLTSDAASDQKDVAVADAAVFSVGDLVKIEDDNAWEYNEVSAVDTVTDTLTMVNNLANTYTLAANGKVWIDLIEKTDTTYTLLEYKDAKVFDILKYIAESADKSGVIGFDFRVQWDGEFAFFPKNSKTSPISLSEKIEHSRYSKDIHRVRNKIIVYGAAEKPYPLDTDGQPWSDSLTEDLTKPDNYLQHADGKWEPPIPAHETVSVETTTVHTGSKSVKIESDSYDYYMGIVFTPDSDKYVNGNSYPKLCFTLREDNHHNKRITVGLKDKDGNDCWQGVDIADYDEWQSYTLGVGKQNQEAWTLGYDTFDWENIKEVRFDFHQKTSQYGVAYIDRMHFGGCRWSKTVEDSGSQSSYGLRELTETDEELHSDHECELRGKALLNHLSQPAEFLTLQSMCLDYGTNRLLPGDKIHVTLPNENVDSDFRIISVEYRVSARDQTLEIILELGKERPLLADYLYGLRSTTITVEKLMRTKAGQTGLVGSGGGGGGGGGGDGGADDKVKVSSGDTTTNYLQEKLTAGTGVTLTKKNAGANEDLEIKAHREWKWADEQSWDRVIVIPVQGRPATDGANPSGGWTKSANNPILDLGASGKFDEQYVDFPCVIRVGDTYYLYYTGHRVSDGKQQIGLATATDPYDAFTRYSTDPVIALGGSGDPDENMVRIPSVIYDPVADKFICWYEGRKPGEIFLCRATSDDGKSWTKDSPANVLSFGTTYKSPSVIKVGKFYHCAAVDNNYDMYLWTSNDGINWTFYGKILDRGSAGQWDEDRTLFPAIFWNLGIWYLFYVGRDSSNITRVGMALSTTGWSFTKHIANPVLSMGSSGQWDETRIGKASVLMVERTFYLWYHGVNSSGTERIGVAKMEV